MELKTFRNNFLPTGMDKAQRDTVISAIFNEVTGRDFVTSLVMGYELDADELAKMNEYAARVQNGEPVQYVLGKWDFMGRSFAVDERVLIPRADTELLCELALEHIASMGSDVSVLDLCTGSGCIGISISLDAKNTSVFCSDISEDALCVAYENAKTLGAQIEFIQSDMLTNCGVYDVIVSNPPYIPSSIVDELDTSVKNFEPRGALDGGDDGLDFYRIIANEAKSHLTKNGALFLEIGYDQRDSVCKLLKDRGYINIECYKDIAQNDRVIKCILKG
ncbi:MAG: peptide chain release factor N(5)-glutamine methyltransferase [Clostridiales bacterium]|nr:peptide chain release factor N(5)-glutamine methyltransferase [Clostridiales bacterium]